MYNGRWHSGLLQQTKLMMSQLELTWVEIITSYIKSTQKAPLGP